MQDVALVLFESEGRVPHSFAFCANEWVTEPSLRDEIPRLHDCT